MRDKGVVLPRRVLHDRYAVKHWGSLTIADISVPALRRVVKIARLALDTGDRVLELHDSQISWVTDQNFELRGFEMRDVDGELVHYAQGWLCTIELDEGDVGSTPQREAKRAARQ
ncbi:hypothetical protein [Pseudoduganella umbonata]|uniref:Uncharacterized protein n=1 Tax=Pseudoduganella umbonata TaxID=864828 RepID=A0A4P8HLP2_9BURK|nr:hypothetical protein [Pseudoduganella umbonata]MBB3221692.1 hypothetical protein [Pseudoduganella umbonata]QCP09085.1 hypothetical protein FCL38_00510 [Pseudoduganella umbonata]